MRIIKQRTNHLVNPVGYGFDRFTVSWVAEAGGAAQKQTAARVRVLKGTLPEAGPETAAPVFDSGKQGDISSLGYALPIELEPYTRYFWNVTVWADNGEEAESEWAFFETAKMDDPWQAQWIRADLDDVPGSGPGSGKDTHTYLRTEFTLDKEPVWARAYVCGLGLYELEVNGSKAGDEYLLPGFHSYDCFVQYQTFDIGPYLREGKNAVGAMLGPGWYKGRLMFDGGFSNLYGDTMQLICEIRLRFKDGRELVIGSGPDWQGRASPVQSSGIYDGEVYAADRPPEGWGPVQLTGRGTADLQGRINPPIIIHERLKPQKLIRTTIGEWVLDFGQEITGWVEITLKKGTPGIKLSYAEIMQEGRFYRDNLRTAKAEYVYTAAAEDTGNNNAETVTVRPHFTFFGFRYVKVEMLTEPNTEDFTACAIYSDIEEAGWIETSNPKVNRLFLNSLWSQKDNFLDIPTDCPQRDERMGWTGDAAIFAETAHQNMYTPAFFNHYLKSLRGEQERLQGAVPFFVPVPKPKGEGQTIPFWGKMPSVSVWGDVAAILPWSLYLMYGDPELLSRHYPIMKDWVDYVISQDEADGGKGLWQTGFHLGDWLALDTGDPQSPMGGTDTHYIASAFYHNSVTILSKAAAILGYGDDEKKYRIQADKIKKAFIKIYFNADGTLAIPETQTALTAALYFGLFPDAQGGRLLKALVRRIEAKDTHLDTGFVGTPLLCQVLSKYGANETAYSLLLQDSYPSWLYEVGMGATTIWERWNSVLPNGKISGTGMNSLNHYSYGSIVNWMYRCMGGLNPLEEGPGYKKVRIAPLPDRRIPRFRLVRETAAGRYEIAWEWCEEGKVKYAIHIPFDCEALIALPGREEFSAGPGDYSFTILPR